MKIRPRQSECGGTAPEEKASIGAFFSGLGGRILAGKKTREDTERNRKRLEDAALVSRELNAQRIADEEIRKIAVRLAYEADAYIAAARESEDAFYDPLALDALDAARAALNTWKKNENDAAAGKYLKASGIPGGIVIPADEGQKTASTGQGADSAENREKTLGILGESLRLFIVQNTIRTAGDPDAALAALASGGPGKI